MLTPLTIADQQTLKAQIATIDLQISKLTTVIGTLVFKTGSLMLSGKTNALKEYHTIIIWDKSLPIPAKLMHKFLQDYADDLVTKRLNLYNIVETGMVPFEDMTVINNCDSCRKQTIQRNYLFLPGSGSIIIPTEQNTLICTECKTILIHK
jgi:hypothetical protein